MILCSAISFVTHSLGVVVHAWMLCLMLEQFSSWMTEVCSVINRSLVCRFHVVVHEYVPILETDAHVKVLLFVVFRCCSWMCCLCWSSVLAASLMSVPW